MTTEIDASELAELLAVVQSWSTRKEQLPEALRQQITWMEGTNLAQLVKMAKTAKGMSIEAAPALRTLAANLRAQEKTRS